MVPGEGRPQDWRETAQDRPLDRQPAASASASEQNQRSPLRASIVTISYQGLHGM
jgi:hypothetical protein